MTPTDILPLNGVDDDAKLAVLTASMIRDGWAGAPVVYDATMCQAYTGSHRLFAAQDAGIDIKAVEIRELCTEHEVDWDELVEEYGDWYEALRRLDEHLPAHVIDYYGIDAH